MRMCVGLNPARICVPWVSWPPGHSTGGREHGGSCAVSRPWRIDFPQRGGVPFCGAPPPRRRRKRRPLPS
eukprot:8896135-Lingulodinium_polyedra.AAC.1